MAYTIKDLREMSEDRLIEEHDKIAMHVVMGTNYFLEELDRRSRNKFEKFATILATFSAITSAIAVITSLIALFK